MIGRGWRCACTSCWASGFRLPMFHGRGILDIGYPPHPRRRGRAALDLRRVSAAASSGCRTTRSAVVDEWQAAYARSM